ncbi:MAG TPA: hypothetical protein PLU87_17005 [Sedimentisphaerales bacterium]|nr:hypothetical protein [Sedimentisphaerales bacterium]HRS12757.1 hypothetical protein [Sedimentisphaerales bacterium]HRV49366.1 hypothetical protein [Sedimentisphaerales bacterium]
MTSQATTSLRGECTFALYPVRPFDHMWGFDLWGWPLLAERSGPFKVPDPDDPSEAMIIERLKLRGQPGYEVWLSVSVLPDELPDGLTDQEPFTDEDKSLLMALGLARVVDGVFRPDWWCLQSHLVVVRGVPERHLPGLFWRDILQLIHARLDHSERPSPLSGASGDRHRYYERAMSKKEIGQALGQDGSDRKISEKVDALFRAFGCDLRKLKHANYLVPLDVLPPHFLDRFRRYVKDFDGVDLK